MNQPKRINLPQHSKALIDLRQAFKESSSQQEGCICPVCDRFGKIHKTPITASGAFTLLKLYEALRTGNTDKEGFVHIESYMTKQRIPIKGAHSRLQHWGLCEIKMNNDDTKRTSGFWKITEKGKRFIFGQIKIPKSAWMYNEKVLEWEDDNMIDIHQALNNKFNYQEVMSAYLGEAPKVTEEGQQSMFGQNQFQTPRRFDYD